LIFRFPTSFNKSWNLQCKGLKEELAKKNKLSLKQQQKQKKSKQNKKQKQTTATPQPLFTKSDSCLRQKKKR